jgi:hypothetical protein
MKELEREASFANTCWALESHRCAGTLRQHVPDSPELVGSADERFTQRALQVGREDGGRLADSHPAKGGLALHRRADIVQAAEGCESFSAK